MSGAEELSPEAAYLEAAHAVGNLLLEHLDRICRTHDIPYFVGAGTLIGTLREKGWIPWDDDVDIFFFRDDYERFRLLASDELPDEVQFTDARSNPQQLSSIPRLMYLPSERMPYERERIFRPIEVQHVVLDIFLLDVAPPNALLRRLWPRVIKGCERMVVARAMTVRHALAAEKTPRLAALAAVVASRILTADRWKALHFLACTGPGRVWGRRSTNPMVCLANDFKQPYRRVPFSRDDFFPPRTGQFEHLQVPIPARAERILETLYGDFMTPPADPEVLHLRTGVRITLDGITWTFSAESVTSEPVESAPPR
jgi:lipopolysaccharide cholinephosphotransferase